VIVAKYPGHIEPGAGIIAKLGLGSNLNAQCSLEFTAGKARKLKDVLIWNPLSLTILNVASK
jgi:hypothetical protein